MPHSTLLRTLGAICALATLAALLVPAAAMQPVGLRLLRADDDAALIELRAPAFALREVAGAAAFVVDGATADPARPGLPVFYATLGAPPGAALSLVADASETVNSRPGLRLVAPAAPSSPPLGPDGNAVLVEPAPVPPPPNACAPLAPARISADGRVRGQRLVTIAFSPLDYCPASGELRWRPHIRAELRWPHKPTLAGAPAVADPLLDTLMPGALLNERQARAWRAEPEPAAPVAALAQTIESTHPERYKISLRAEGLYQISYADLQAAGAPVATLDPRSFRLTSRGQPVAISVSGEADGRFDPADTILFYGQPLAGGPVRDSVILNGQLVVADTVVSRNYSADTDYGDLNVYWLELGGSPGPRMASQPAAPQPAASQPASFRATVRAEEQQIWWSYHFTSRDVWVWARLAASGVVTASFPIDLPSPAPAGAPAALRAELIAFTHNPAVNPDHHTRALFNGVLVEDAAWDGPTRHAIVASLPATTLEDGPNTLDLGARSLPGATDWLFFDWLEVSYDRRFVAAENQLRFDYPAGHWRFELSGFAGPAIRALDVTSPRSPRLLAGLAVTPDGAGYQASFSAQQSGPRRYLVVGDAGLLRPERIERRPPTSLRDPANGADYIVIAPGALLDAARELAAYRAARGMRAIVVDVADLYDDFNHGIYHPVAIKRFLAYAYATWRAPAPQYVVLVGDGHWNPMNRSPNRYDAGPVLMPPNLAWVDPWQGQVDSSNQLAAIVGDDILPDLAIGRMPVRTPAELRQIIAKTAAHEAAPADAPWRARLLFMADNGPDSAGDFAGSMDAVIDAAVPPNSFALDRLYLDALCGPNQGGSAPCPPAAAALRDTLNLTGTLMLTYAGHATISSWAHETLTVAGVAQLGNADRPPFLVSLDCLDGYWYYPRNDRDSLVETLLREPNGVAAAFAPTGLGLATGHSILQRGLYDALFAGGPRRLGPATMAARLALATSGASLDLVDTYTIFGDPALQLALPRSILTRPTATPSPTRTSSATPTGTLTTTPTASATPTGTLTTTPTASATPTGTPGRPGGLRTYLPWVEHGARP